MIWRKHAPLFTTFPLRSTHTHIECHTRARTHISHQTYFQSDSLVRYTHKKQILTPVDREFRSELKYRNKEQKATNFLSICAYHFWKWTIIYRFLTNIWLNSNVSENKIKKIVFYNREKHGNCVEKFSAVSLTPTPSAVCVVSIPWPPNIYITQLRTLIKRLTNDDEYNGAAIIIGTTQIRVSTHL